MTPKLIFTSAMIKYFDVLLLNSCDIWTMDLSQHTKK